MFTYRLQNAPYIFDWLDDYDNVWYDVFQESFKAQLVVFEQSDSTIDKRFANFCPFIIA